MAIETVQASGEDAPESGDEKILSLARSRFKLAEDAERTNRANALDDKKFRAGDHWEPALRAEREREGRPCLTVNRLPQFIQQVTNDQRQNRPSIKIHPVDDKGDIETAKVKQGLIRHIEYDSDAEAAYDTAFEHAVESGFGYIRIRTAYVSPMSFDQKIVIDRVRDQMSVLLDPFSTKSDGSDANWGFQHEVLSKEEYESAYPDSKLSAGGDAWNTFGAAQPDWFPDGAARIAEYFTKEYKRATICLLANGQVVEEAEYKARVAALAKAGQQLPPEFECLKTRVTNIPTVKWYKISGCEILERTDWPGQWIPLVPVYGTELFIDGKRILEGIVRHAKDSQRMQNFWKSAEAEAIALAPKAPYIAAEGQIKGYENIWKAANRVSVSVLPYVPVSIAGHPVPPPQRNSFEPAIQAISMAAAGSAEDMKATTGIYDATLGGRSNETSGVAIQRRNQQAQTSTFHYVDNLTRSIKHVGRICLDLMPFIYDTARAERILGEDGVGEVKKLNQATDELDENGQPRIFAMDEGQYDASVDVGPSFASKRQEAAESMLEMTKAAPQLMGIAGDLIVKNLDFPGSADLAERIKKTLDPKLVEDPKNQSPVPPHIQAQLQQQAALIEQLTEKANANSHELETKRVELESRERIEFKKLEVQVELKRAELDQQSADAIFAAELAQINRRLDLLQIDAPVGAAEPSMNAQPEMGAPEQPPMGMPQDEFAPAPDGAPGADVGDGAFNPTGGESPGSPMEGN